VAQPPFKQGAHAFCLKKKATTVDAVPFAVLSAAMTTAAVPGAAAATNKDALIELMVKYNCDFEALPLPVIRNATQSSSQPAAAAAAEPRTPGTATDDETSDEGGEDGYEGMSGKSARDYLQEYGPSKGDILEIHPDVAAKRAGERWFMIVQKPNVVYVNGENGRREPSIESCRWCRTNSLRPCNIFTDPTHCLIRNVKAWGLSSATLFKKFAPAPAAPTRKVDPIKTREEISQPWLKHDESCTCRMCSGLPAYKQQGQKDE
jgi:hypothetical protein